jgi:hypothetical protein
MKQIFAALFLILSVLPAGEAQQQPVDTKQYAVGAPQAPVGTRALPEQRAFPKDQWGRSYVPGINNQGRQIIEPGKGRVSSNSAP